MAYPCPTCHGRHGWWAGKEDGHRVFLPRAGAVVWRECHDCIGGISSCCDGAVGSADEVTNQGLPEKRDD